MKHNFCTRLEIVLHKIKEWKKEARLKRGIAFNFSNSVCLAEPLQTFGYRNRKLGIKASSSRSNRMLHRILLAPQSEFRFAPQQDTSSAAEAALAAFCDQAAEACNIIIIIDPWTATHVQHALYNFYTNGPRPISIMHIAMQNRAKVKKTKNTPAQFAAVNLILRSSEYTNVFHALRCKLYCWIYLICCTTQLLWFEQSISCRTARTERS